MSNQAWVTLATNDSYALGALVLAHSLRRVGSAHPAVVLITPSVSENMRNRLSAVFAQVVTVDVLDSRDAAHLALLARPELGVTFTKIHCWSLTQYDKCVFLDADTLVVQNCDELFEREELSAAPDVGWPDCFNSGVFVYRPSEGTFNNLLEFAKERGSFDGGDQGLLNSYFSSWARGDINKHLPFLYNVTSVAFYSYLPALKEFGQDMKIIHFIGNAKPWLQRFNWETRTVDAAGHAQPTLQLWWDLFVAHVHPQLDQTMMQVQSVEIRYEPHTSHYSFEVDPKSQFPWHRIREEEEKYVKQSYIDKCLAEFHDPWENYRGNIQSHESKYESEKRECTETHARQEVEYSVNVDWNNYKTPYYHSHINQIHGHEHSYGHHEQTYCHHEHSQSYIEQSHGHSHSQYDQSHDHDKSQSYHTESYSHQEAVNYNQEQSQNHYSQVQNYCEYTSELKSDYSDQHGRAEQNEEYCSNVNNNSACKTVVELLSNYQNDRSNQKDNLCNGYTQSNSCSESGSDYTQEEEVRARHPYDNFYLLHRCVLDHRGRKICSHEAPSPAPTPPPPPTPSPSPELQIDQVDANDTGLAGTLSRLTLGAASSQQAALDEHTRRQGWEAGNIDYLGADSFANIWAKISATLAQAPEATPTQEVKSDPIPTSAIEPQVSSPTEAVKIPSVVAEPPSPSELVALPSKVTAKPTEVAPPTAEVAVPRPEISERLSEVVPTPSEETLLPSEVDAPCAQVALPPSEVTAPSAEVTIPATAVDEPLADVANPLVEVIERSAEVAALPAEPVVAEPLLDVNTPPIKAVTPPTEVAVPPTGDAAVPSDSVPIPADATPLVQECESILPVQPVEIERKLETSSSSTETTLPSESTKKSESAGPVSPPASIPPKLLKPEETPAVSGSPQKPSEVVTPITPKPEVEDPPPSPSFVTPQKDPQDTSTDSPPLVFTPVKEAESPKPAAGATKEEEVKTEIRKAPPPDKLFCHLKPAPESTPLLTPDSEQEDAATLAQKIIASELGIPITPEVISATPPILSGSPSLSKNFKQLSVEEPELPTPPVSLEQIGIKPKSKIIDEQLSEGIIVEPLTDAQLTEHHQSTDSVILSKPIGITSEPKVTKELEKVSEQFKKKTEKEATEVVSEPNIDIHRERENVLKSSDEEEKDIKKVLPVANRSPGTDKTSKASSSPSSSDKLVTVSSSDAKLDADKPAKTGTRSTSFTGEHALKTVEESKEVEGKKEILLETKPEQPEPRKKKIVKKVVKKDSSDKGHSSSEATSPVSDALTSTPSAPVPPPRKKEKKPVEKKQ